MNKKQLNKIVSLSKEGLPVHTCVIALLQIALPNVDGVQLRDLTTDIFNLLHLIAENSNENS